MFNSLFGFQQKKMTDIDRNKSVVTVGPRATLPSIYVENETAGYFGSNSLRYRNRIADDELTNNDRIKGGKIDSYDDRSIGSSIRSTPSYGTPGTSARLIIIIIAIEMVKLTLRLSEIEVNYRLCLHNKLQRLKFITTFRND